MHPKLKGVIKPIIEVMAALPSVVLGFLAGLWLAPKIDKILLPIACFPILLIILTIYMPKIWERVKHFLDFKKEGIVLDYKTAGVDIDAGNKFAKSIPITSHGFGGMFQVPSGYEEPILVSGTDGVGTKIDIAQAANDYTTIGIDLVAMCVNDLIVQGAKPLFFLDYIAVGKLNLKKIKLILKGIIKGCRLSNCELIGGETSLILSPDSDFFKFFGNTGVIKSKKQ